MKQYNHAEVEKKWQTKWETENTFAASNSTEKPAYFALVEFPYPSGQGLHVGHPRSYTALDVVARKRRMQCYNVLYPMDGTLLACRPKTMPLKTIFIPKL